MRSKKRLIPALSEPPPEAIIYPSGISRRTALLGAGAISLLAAVGLETFEATSAEAGPWGGYQNGQIPLSQLTSVGGTRLRADAATGMANMMAAHSAALGSSLVLTEGYRDLAGQHAAWNLYGPPRAARPGTSPHGWALAMDFGGSAYNQGTTSWNWLLKNSQQYGWWWAGGSFAYKEPWHWEFNGTYVSPTNPTPSPITEEDENMKWYLREDGTQTIAGAFSWVDYGIPERALIVGTLLCDQTAPISITFHQWNILREEYLVRVGQYKIAFPGAA